MQATSEGIQPVPARVMLIMMGVVYGLLAVVLSAFLARNYLGALAVSLSAIGVFEITQNLFRRHRDLCWKSTDQKAPDAATTDLILNLTSILVGLIIAFAIFAVNLNRADVMKVFSFQITGVFFHQLAPQSSFYIQFALAVISGTVLAGLFFILAAIYKEGGIALITSWVASLWGIGLMMRFRTGDASDPVAVLLIVLSLIAGSMGFLSSGMAGIFLARGAFRYSIRSERYLAIAKTSIMILAGALGFILFSAVLSALAGTRIG